MRRIGAWYTTCLEVQPILTRSCTTSVILGLGDVISQKVIEKRERLDKLRTAQMMIYGVFIGPQIHWWYSTMDRLIMARPTRIGQRMNPVAWASHTFNNFQKRNPLFKYVPGDAWIRVLIDQASCGPFFILEFYVVMTCLTTIRLELTKCENEVIDWDQCFNKCYTSTLERIQFSYVNTYFAGWRLWPIAQTINFSLIPPLYRVLYANCISLLWNTYLAFKQQEKIGSHLVDDSTKNQTILVRNE